MSGFAGILRFELGYYFRRVSTWVYFGIFFLFSFLLVQLAGGAWSKVQMSLGGSGGSVWVNSPYVTTGLMMVMALFGVLVTAALLGHAVYRDFEVGIHPLFFTTPISKYAYLGGRFASALLVNAVIFASIPLGMMLGSAMPWLDAERFGAFRLVNYAYPFAVFVLPNLLFTGALFFALAAVTRRMLPNYVGGAFLLIGYTMSSHYLENLENERLAVFLDSFGFAAFDLASRYWTPAEKNVLLTPLDGLLLGNRAAWVGLGLLVLVVAAVRFRLEHHARELRIRRRRVAETPAAASAPPAHGLALPAVLPRYGAAAQVVQLLSIARRSFWGIVSDRYFFALVLGGVIYMVFTADLMGDMYGTATWPVTYNVLETLGGNFWLFMLIIITLYAGDLVWTEREVRLNQVVDATPVPSWVLLLGKWTGLVLMLAVLQGVVMITGVLIQAFKGYTNFELGLYARTLFGAELLSFVLLSALVMLVHVVANHKYFAHLVVVGFLVFTSFMGAMGLQHSLYRFNSGGMGTYSDMNGFGPWVEPFFWLKGYWVAWALLFAVASNLFWIRGQETGASWRVRLARLRFTRPAISAVALAGLLIMGLGGFIFYNTNVVNEYATSYQEEAERAEYERLYKRFQNAPQPRITAVDLRVEIYPRERDVTVAGHYQLRNKTDAPIDSVHVLLGHEAEIRKLELSRPARRVHADQDRHYYIFRLDQPLQPGDSVALNFDLAHITEGFANRMEHLHVVENGTFLNSTVLPGIGYEPDGELSDDDTRRKHGLKPKERMAPVNDPAGRRNPFIARDADWIRFQATVGTSDDQVALAPGYLQREWTEGGRRYFHYQMDAPILNFYAFLSGRYQVKRDRWNDVAIEVYHHPGHEYNVDRMIEAVKQSLDYFTKNFGPYQHRQVRILEFPRYQSFAQAFPNTIPYSEAIGFIARVEDSEEDIDYPFYVTAHEVAHQWWGYQAVSGAVAGAGLISETLSQYSALMVMEQEYGRAQMRRFLAYELDKYLRGRALERKKEQPLLTMEGQQYIHYNKGSLAMYLLRDHIGEEKLNAALRGYLEAVRFQEPPYTNSLELYQHLQSATPDSLRYVLEDLFEHITLYENRTKEASYQRLPDGRYRVTLQLEARKMRADSVGNERDIPMNDLVDIGVFAENSKDRKKLGDPLYFRKHRIRGGEQTLEITVDKQPAQVGIDPYYRLIDRNRDDNSKLAKERKPS